MKKKIPALCLSGGRLKDFVGHSKAVEYRVWIHPNNGDDFYCRSKNKKTLDTTRKKMLNDRRYALVEPIIAVVYDAKFKKFREVAV